jgi:hypothetical protein
MTTVELPYPLVLVEWADAHTSEAGWQSLEDLEDDGECIVQTVGFLIPSSDSGAKADHVSLWQTLCQGEGIHGMYIPSGMVRRIIVLSPTLDNVTPHL